MPQDIQNFATPHGRTTVAYTVEPANLFNLLRRDPSHADNMAGMARDLGAVGDLDVSLTSTSGPGGQTSVTYLLDARRNHGLVRDVQISETITRLRRAFGQRQLPEQQAGQPPPHADVPPPTSFLGDVARLAGMIVGLGLDYLMRGIWWIFRSFSSKTSGGAPAATPGAAPAAPAPPPPPQALGAETQTHPPSSRSPAE